MFKTFNLTTTVLISLQVIVLYACATSPTGIRQLKLFPDAQMAEMGVAAYSEMKKNTPLSKDRKKTRYVTCVAKSITDALPDLDAHFVDLSDLGQSKFVPDVGCDDVLYDAFARAVVDDCDRDRRLRLR